MVQNQGPVIWYIVYVEEQMAYCTYDTESMAYGIEYWEFPKSGTLITRVKHWDPL